jgi:uncharacterized protein (DUF924 family)
MSDPNCGPEDICEFWFPDTGFWKDQSTFSRWIYDRMQGGMDDAIRTHFQDVTLAAARSELDHWAETVRGRLALLIVLDQFPRSLWRDTPAAFAQDIKATRLALEGIQNGHFKAAAPWERLFYVIALGHCEGPDHLKRLDLMDRLTEDLIADLPPTLTESGDRIRAQNARVRSVIERFGRHPHRNTIYRRPSSAAEEAYISLGDFPHLAKGPAPEATGLA